MPDWVSNDLQITGPEAELQRFVAECFTVESTGLRFDFDKLIPIPAALKGTPGQDGTQGDVYGLGLGEGLFPDWYVWSIRNWGTKWNAHHTEITQANSGSNIKLQFDTAWSIPCQIYEKLAERFPLLTIEGDFFEPMMEFGRHIRCQGGKIEYEDKSAQVQGDMAALRTIDAS